MLQFGVLGPVRAERSGVPLPLSGPKPRDLLAALLSRPGETVSVHDLCTAVWGSDSPPSARKTIQIYVSRLRMALGPERIVSQPTGYKLVAGSDELDSARFAELVAAAKKEPSTRVAAQHYERALKLWYGPAFDGSAEHSPVAQAAAYLDEQRLEAQKRLAEIHLDLHAPELAVPLLRSMLDLHPFREDIWALLLRALVKAGRQSEAVEAFHHIRQRLGSELGVEPGGQLQHEYESILRTDTATSKQTVRPRELPFCTASFTGRRAELNRMDEVLLDRSARLAVISGSAGTGKTALAVQWARLHSDAFPDGQIYLNLNGFSATAALAPLEALASMLRSLGVSADRVPQDIAGASAMFRSLVADRQIVVLLDNAQSAEQVRPLLPGSVTCATIVTSRYRLTSLVAMEEGRPIDLGVMAPDEASQLLQRLLGERRTAAEPTALDALARACAYLPLALRVAGASLHENSYRGIGECATTLESGSPLAELAIDGDMQAVVRSAFDLSYRDIDRPLRRTFRLLGLITADNFSSCAVAAITGLDPTRAMQHLTRLCNAHLLEREGTDRFTFHDLLRSYAAETTLAQDPQHVRHAARKRLYAYYLRHVLSASQLLYPNLARLPAERGDPDPPQWTIAEATAWLDNERRGIVATIIDAAGGDDSAPAWRLADALRRYGSQRLHPSQWLPAVEAAAAAADRAGNVDAHSAMLYGLANTHRCSGRLDLAITCLEAALAHTAASPALIWAYTNALGCTYFESGQMGKGEQIARQALDMATAFGASSGRASILSNLGYAFVQTGRIAEAVEYSSAAAEISVAVGDRLCEGSNRLVLGMALIQAGRIADGIQTLNTARELKSAVGDLVGEAVSLARLALAYIAGGRFTEARLLARQALDMATSVADLEAEEEALSALAAAELTLGESVASADLFHRALELSRRTGAKFHEATALSGLAQAYAAQGDDSQARDCAKQAQAICQESGYHLPAID